MTKVNIVPTTGRIVLYRFTAEKATELNARPGGTRIYAGEDYPAIVIVAWGGTPESYVNLRVFLDGPEDHWATNVKCGDEPGDYHWMPYQIGQAKKHETDGK